MHLLVIIMINIIQLMSTALDQKTIKLQQILKNSLEQCVALAKKKIRSKKGLTDLQNLLVDYSENVQLADIILSVIKLVSNYQTVKKDESEEVKQTVTIEQYNSLETSLQRFQSSVREHIKTEQQLKIYCDDIEQKNQELQKNNQELLKSTKIIITNLKRENQRLIQENATLLNKAKEHHLHDKQKDQTLVNSIKKARKLIDSHNSQTYREESGSWTDRQQQHLKGRKSSLSIIRQS